MKCLDDHCKQFPSNTAPAGYTCPTCCSALFPPSNLVSPVADVLRTVLTNRPWAREGLGLPLLPFDPTDNESNRGEAAPPSMKEIPTNYSVVNVEADSPNTFHRNEPGIISYHIPISFHHSFNVLEDSDWNHEGFFRILLSLVVGCFSK